MMNGHFKRPLLLAILLAQSTITLAASHALIMWIGEYEIPANNLPGIYLDATNARRIATSMGVPESNMKEVRNRELTIARLNSEFNGLYERIKYGDNIFIYYSGHGGQQSNTSGTSKCSEGIITSDMRLYDDGQMEAALKRLSSKAGQVVFMNDSCFSGGAATKTIDRSLDGGDSVPKYLPDTAIIKDTGDSRYQCGQAINKVARSLEQMSQQEGAPRLLYIAAASEVEYASATPNGSTASLAWVSCINSDTNRSGSVDGEELRSCSQKRVNELRGRQTIVLKGNIHLPLMFPTSVAGSPGYAEPAGAGSLQINPSQMLQDISNAGSRDYLISLLPSTRDMRIGVDALDFAVESNKQGYLYIFQVGSDGVTVNQLFPNKFDTDNLIKPGSYRFPRPSWRVKSAGPAGNSYLLAVISPEKKSFTQGMDLSSAFPTAAASPSLARNLVVSAAEQGSYGASKVIAIKEH